MMLLYTMLLIVCKTLEKVLKLFTIAPCHVIKPHLKKLILYQEASLRDSYQTPSS